MISWRYSFAAGRRLAWLALTCLAPAAARAEDRPAVEYNRDIRPLLADRCFACHGPDAAARQAGLRLDRREDALALLASGKRAIVPGDRQQSELYRRVTTANADERMPPADSGKSLSRDEQELIARWLDAGAAYEQHWSLAAPRRPTVPTFDPASPHAAWPRSPPDAFLLASMLAAGVQPSPPADRALLVRRLSLDLRGLPPAWEEVEAFLQDNRPDAYERLVDRFLASPHFGERMAIHWLDLVRYADTVGYHGDQERPIAAYRDYVIDAFNADLPFDRFTIEQLAGDLLPDATVRQRVASGYNMLGMTTIEGGAQPGEYLAKYASDRVRNVAGVWLGATFGCAECHDHKYDPYTTREFYQLAAFFADLRQEGVGDPIADLLLPTSEQEQELARLDADLASLAADQDAGARRDELAAQKKALLAHVRKTIPAVSVAPRVTRVLPRGDWLNETGKIVEPAVPASLPALLVEQAAGHRATRLDLARWLVDGRHPQTARVFANRIWKQFFGIGLSSTLDDCGSQGEWPRQLDLLDWLAADFVAGGWSVKRAVKLLVMSNAYRQTSLASAALREADPHNRLHARQSRVRLEAETIRDNALAIGGLLSARVGGDSARPYQPAGYYALLNFPQRDYVADTGEQQYRRGVYTHWQRTFLHPALLAFDAPSREECTAARSVSNAPQAALALLNDPSHVEAGRALAERMLRQGGESRERQVAWAWRRALAREPGARELETLMSLWQSHADHFRQAPAEAEKLLAVGQTPRAGDLDPAELAAAASVARAILNLDETIARE